MSEAAQSQQPGRPAGDLYDWYRRGLDLISTGNHAAAAQILTHAVQVDPDSPMLRELLARALFDAGDYDSAALHFALLVHRTPDDDYARFGWGMALWRQQEFTVAADQLAAAVAMRPDQRAYQQALTQVRATLRARADAGLPANGPLPRRDELG